jgi:hypothetical protein
LCTVKQDAEEGHEQDEADDGSDHVRDRDRQRESAAGIARLFHAQRLPWISPLGNS